MNKQIIKIKNKKSSTKRNQFVYNIEVNHKVTDCA